MIDIDRAFDYLEFVQERHRVWERRQEGLPQPWTEDPIIATRKFTSVFRILDPGTQYVVEALHTPELPPEDTLLRSFLYRHTGRIEAWDYIDLNLGELPTIDNLDDALDVMKDYRGKGKVRRKPPRREGQTGRGNGFQSTSFERPVFTNAYLVFPQSGERGTDKLESIFNLTRRLFHQDSPDFICDDFFAARTQADRFAVLRRNKGVADFMSMQVLTDWGYSHHADPDPELENRFVVLGPGARRGAAAIDPQSKPDEVLEWAYREVQSLGEPSLDLPGGGVRLPSRMDIQNTLCEFSKYVRYQGKPAATKPYRPAHPGPQEPPLLPKHWH